VQYAALQGVAATPGVDQRTLARTHRRLDTSTTGGVIDRLEARALLQRSANPDDRRVRLLTLTPRATPCSSRSPPPCCRAQQRILEPLPAAERRQFMRMLRTLVETDRCPEPRPQRPEEAPVQPPLRGARPASPDRHTPGRFGTRHQVR
jgi:DNA-binding MarR family transcriptional regulator